MRRLAPLPALRALGLLACLGLTLTSQAATAPATVPTVQTSQGSVSGLLVNGVRAYRGIPFAAPPVAALRWQAPQAPQPWASTRDGSQFSSSCPQPKTAISTSSTNEDCLYLNVHVPDDIGTAKLPVMVWIHGGSFEVGASSDYDMTTLARKARAIVVSVNYRLGVFGFFRQPELSAQNAPANFGLQDQQAALRWVRSQVAGFGGDASRVTLFGESAGGASVCLHMVSPASAGLFHRAISESGPCGLLSTNTASLLESAGADLGTSLACPAGPGQLACMRALPVATLLTAASGDGSTLSTGFRWTPVQDGVTLLDSPAKLVAQGRFHKVPAIFGTNHDEGRMFVAKQYHLTTFLPVSTKQLAEAISDAAQGDATLGQQLTAVYTAKNHGSRDKALGALLTDSLFSCSAILDATALTQHVPTYFYEFTEPNTPGNIDPYMALGAFHGVELRYLFQAKLPGPLLNLPLSSAQQKLADQLVKYWGQFAATGNPNGGGLPQWNTFDPGRATVLSLAASAVASHGAEMFKADHRCALWD